MLLTQILFSVRRRVLTGKDGNKNFYKGRGVRNPGFMTSKGRYRIVPKKVPEYIVPDLTDCKLKPYVSYKAPRVHCSPITAEGLIEAIKENHDVLEHKEVP